ncbi:MAG: tetratricopeptide repeat protein, partial [Pseudomonadota bacterium]
VKISLGEGDKADAMRLLDEIFEIEKDNSQALITRARIELAEGRAVAAIADLRTVIKNEPNSQEALMLLGNAHEAAGSVDLALDSYKTAVSLNPRNELAMLKIASLSMAEEDYETAKRLLFAVLDTNPSSSEARRLFTALYAQQENWTEATKYAESLENSDTGNQSVLGMYLKSRIQVEQGNCSSALDTLKEVMQLEPNAVEALAQMKDCYVELGLEDEGRRYFLDHVSDNPEHAHAHALLGDLAFAVRDYGTASTAYSQASTLEPAKATHTIGLARALAASGEEEAALDVYEELIESTPGSTDARLYKAELLEALEQYSNAAELYESVLKIDSSNIVASNNLAMILVDHLNSEENIRRAIEITEGFEETDYPALWDTRGWAYYHAAQYTLALALLERVIASPDAQAVFYYHIGMTHYKLGDLDQARMALAKSLGFPSAEFYGRDNARVLVGTI